MKGIILAGGLGSRLYPSTLAVCKQLFPIFDKPMIYYPLSVLMLANIRDILIISKEGDVERFFELFKYGEDLGISISYAVQDRPSGIAEAFKIGSSFLGDKSVALILGDNLFYGDGFRGILRDCVSLEEGGIIFGYRVCNPKRYGVVEFDEELNILSIEEKPEYPRSDYVIPGLYFYDNSVLKIVDEIRPSKRGELEISDINRIYLEMGKLKMKMLGRGFAWLDTGTFEDFQKASNFVQAVQDRQGIKVACIEEVAYMMGFIDEERVFKIANRFDNEYGEYLRGIISVAPCKLNF